MAQGYLNSEQEEEMEIIGKEYFSILASRSLFQDFKKDDDDNIVSCKMHDIVHDFAQFISQNECLSIEINGGEESSINSLDRKVCHLMVNLGYNAASFPAVATGRLKRLYSLLIDCDNNIDNSSLIEFLQELFSESRCLRALDFGYRQESSDMIREILINAEKLVHLRYLNLDGQSMETLPEMFCELYNLQYLNVSGCIHLRELPQGIGKLVNLRHLLNSGTVSLTCMPIGIARLTNLRRLTKFIVGRGVDGTKACGIESLKSLGHLREPRIDGLVNVLDVGEAKRCQLDKKKNLLSLSLLFDEEEEEGRRKNKDDEQLLEALQPPQYLQELVMVYCRGSTVSPNWMTSLTNLKNLTLSEFRNCEQLPPLGKLPSLEKLYIAQMRSVKE